MAGKLPSGVLRGTSLSPRIGAFVAGSGVPRPAITGIIQAAPNRRPVSPATASGRPRVYQPMALMIARRQIDAIADRMNQRTLALPGFLQVGAAPSMVVSFISDLLTNVRGRIGLRASPSS